jgi:hypothetical protein
MQERHARRRMENQWLIRIPGKKLVVRQSTAAAALDFGEV